MKAKIEIEMDNAAFGYSSSTELARILIRLASEIEVGAGLIERRLLDSNGNVVGTFKISGGKRNE